MVASLDTSKRQWKQDSARSGGPGRRLRGNSEAGSGSMNRSLLRGEGHARHWNGAGKGTKLRKQVAGVTRPQMGGEAGGR